jgi:hypothetical protein
MEVSEEHFAKAPPSIVVNESGNEMKARERQP